MPRVVPLTPSRVVSFISHVLCSSAIVSKNRGYIGVGGCCVVVGLQPQTLIVNLKGAD